jgi:hypothetical protein
MLKESMQSLAKTIRALFAGKASVAVFAGMYVLFLGSLYGFIAIREATIVQVLLTLLFIALAPLLFFLLQAAIINHAQTGRIDWSRVLRDSTKLALVTIPVILIGLGFMWLLNRWQRHFPAPLFHPPTKPVNPAAGSLAPVPPIHWATILFSTARGFIFGIALPLALVHLWVEAAGRDLLAPFRGGGRAFLTKAGQFLARAFSPGSVFIYALGLLLFGVIPYVLLFVRIPAKGAWSDIVVFSVRLVLVFMFILIGWLITLSTFARRRSDPEVAIPAPIADAAPPNTTTGQVEASA